MTDGTSQGLFIVVAIVIFGIFVSLSYTVFGSMGDGVSGLFNQSISEVAYTMDTRNYIPVEDTDRVYIRDADLEMMIKDNLDIPQEENLTLGDLKSLRNLNGTAGVGYQYVDASVKSLDGLEYAENLEVLVLHGNNVKDLSPLRNLSKLRQINFNQNNRIETLEPLSELTEINQILISNNKLTTLEPIRNLTKMRVLNLGRNDLTDLSPLENMHDLRTLYLGNNTNLSDLTPLYGKTLLNRLDVRVTSVTDVTHFSYVDRVDTDDNVIR